MAMGELGGRREEDEEDGNEGHSFRGAAVDQPGVAADSERGRRGTALGANGLTKMHSEAYCVRIAET